MSTIKELQDLFEGKTVVKVEEPNATEAICKFTLSDGSAFRLHATDLGYWIEKTANGDGMYSDLNSLMKDYYHHKHIMNPQFSFDAPKPLITIEGNAFKLIAADGKVFVGNVSRFSEYEQIVVNHPIGREILAKWSDMGDEWMIGFSTYYDPNIPPELIYGVK